jgi:tetratricopeptide (TPR) repeat protein
VLLEIGQPDRAILELQAAAELSGQIPSVMASLAYAHAAIGRREETQKLLNQLLNRRAEEYVAASDIAALFGVIGEFDEAFRWLDEAQKERAIFLTWLRAWPLFKSLRADPRYVAVLKSIGLSR